MSSKEAFIKEQIELIEQDEASIRFYTEQVQKLTDGIKRKRNIIEHYDEWIKDHHLHFKEDLYNKLEQNSMGSE